MVNYIKYTPELSGNWSRAWSETQKQRPCQSRRLLDSATTSQLQGKLWLVNELNKLDLKFSNVCLVGGWCQLITHYCLITLILILFIIGILTDAKQISYKFNRRYKHQNKYVAITSNIFEKSWSKFRDSNYDLIINTSCEHMYPMKKIKN